MTIRRAAERLREVSSIPVLAAAVLLLAGTAFAGGDRSAHHSSSSGSSGHYAVPSGGGSSSSSSARSGSSSSSSGSSDHSSAPRTAVPVGSSSHHGPDRQPSTRHNGGGHGGHGGSFHGGSFYPYYYPYGFWPRFWWGWYWDDYYGYGREPYPYGGYDRRGYESGSREDMGALDLDISPGRTQVFLDGEKIGIVDNFDGWPQYLWLPKGTYDVVFYLDGYKTLARQVTIYPGVVIDMDDKMEPGQSTLPQDLESKTHERRDTRIDYEKDRAERIDRGTWDHRRDGSGDWRERAPRGERSDADRGVLPAPPRDDNNGRNAAPSGDSGWLRLSVDPDDASVYLDGRFVGTGSELAGMQRGLKVDVGTHHLAIVRPGREPEERDFEVAPGEEIKLSVDLESND